MPRMNTRSAITGLGLTLLLEILLVTSPGTAGILDATWTAPTTNTDGSPLTDLQAYRIYYGTSSAPCLGSSVTQIASPTASPGPSQTVSLRLTGLTIGSLYNVAVTAVDAGGNGSGRRDQQSDRAHTCGPAPHRGRSSLVRCTDDRRATLPGAGRLPS